MSRLIKPLEIFYRNFLYSRLTPDPHSTPTYLPTILHFATYLPTIEVVKTVRFEVPAFPNILTLTRKRSA